MSRMVTVILMCGFIFIGVQEALAQNPKPKYKGQEIYDYFAQFTAEDVVEYAQEAVKYYTPVAQTAYKLPKAEEEKRFNKTMYDFNKRPSKWSVGQFPFIPSITPQRCDEGRALAHLIPEFMKVMNKKGFIKKFRDVTGRKVAWELCEKLRSKPQGVWVFEKQWWPQTDRPLWIGFFLIQIPGTPYQLEAFYPSLKYFPKDIPESKITTKEVKEAERKINRILK